MQSFHIETTISQEGIPVIPKLPIKAGQRISVTIEVKSEAENRPTYPLRGLPFNYTDPFDPAVAPDDWEALIDAP